MMSLTASLDKLLWAMKNSYGPLILKLVAFAHQLLVSAPCLIFTVANILHQNGCSFFH